MRPYYNFEHQADVPSISHPTIYLLIVSVSSPDPLLLICHVVHYLTIVGADMC